MAEPLRLEISMRALRFEDWPSIHEWSQLEDVYRFQVWGPNTSNVVTRKFVEVAIGQASDIPRTRFVWTAVNSDSQVIGIAELRLHDVRSGRAEVSYTVHPKYWGLGCATQMAGWVTEFAFAELSMHRVEATCDSRNAASAAVLRKIGMSHEGRLRENQLIRDGWRDSELFSILESEWFRHTVTESNGNA